MTGGRGSYHMEYSHYEEVPHQLQAKIVAAAKAQQKHRKEFWGFDLKKAPSVSETIDWARTLVLLGIESIDAQQAKETLHILLKYQSDIAKAAKELSSSK